VPPRNPFRDEHGLRLSFALDGDAPDDLHAPVDLATQVQTVVSMAEKAYREQKLVRFDPASRKMRT